MTMILLCPLLIILVISPIIHALHLATEKGYQQKQQSTRRRFLASSSAISTATSSLIGANNAQAAGTDDGTLENIRPSQPVPMNGVGGAPLKPYVIDRKESPWTAPQIATGLGRSRIAARELSPLGRPPTPFADGDVFYPAAFCGEWNVTATLRRKTYPYGLSFVPSRSLVEGSPRYRNEGIDDATSYGARYVPLDDGSRIIADRRFNSLSATRSYNQLSPVEAVEWNPRKDPTLVKFTFAAGQLSPDMKPLGPRRAEVYIAARRKEEVGVGTDGAAGAFAAAERTRQVTIGAGAVIASDTETITEFRDISGDGSSMLAVQRIAVYLTPNPNSREGVLWQQVGGKAIAFFDYDLEMHKVELE